MFIGSQAIRSDATTPWQSGHKNNDNNWLGLSASLLAGEIAFRGYFSKDTTPLGPTRQQQTQVLLLYIGAAAPPLEKCKSSDPNVITILL